MRATVTVDGRKTTQVDSIFEGGTLYLEAKTFVLNQGWIYEGKDYVSSQWIADRLGYTLDLKISDGGPTSTS